MVDAPTWRASNATHVLGRDESRKNIADAVYEIAPNASVIILFQKAPQTAMADTSNDHRKYVRFYRTQSSAGGFLQREAEPAIVQMTGRPMAARDFAQLRCVH